MATSIDTVQYICDQASLGRRLIFKKMFGEFALYVDGKVVALVCDDQLFLKPTAEGKVYLGTVAEAPPYPGARNYFHVSSEMDDSERLGAALNITARALPEPKRKSGARLNAKQSVPRRRTVRTIKKGRDRSE